MQLLNDSLIDQTHAAVAANISMRRARVARARLSENIDVNPHTRPSQEAALSVNDNATMEAIGISEDATVPNM